jgi:hypothetical protein
MAWAIFALYCLPASEAGNDIGASPLDTARNRILSLASEFRTNSGQRDDFELSSGQKLENKRLQCSAPLHNGIEPRRKVARQRTKSREEGFARSRGTGQKQRPHWACEEAPGALENRAAWGHWRREWDSNPRYGFPYTRFPSVRLKPLGHPSRALQCAQYSPARARNKLARRFVQTLASVQKSRVN